MKNFDDIFSRKVKEAFDNYDASHLAEEGWNSYVRKHGTRRRRVLVMPLWARAASIAILVTIGVLFTVRLSHPKAGESLNRIAKVSQGGQTETASPDPNTPAVTNIVNPGQASGAVPAETVQAAETPSPETMIAAEMSVAMIAAETQAAMNAAHKPAAMDLPDNPAEIRLTDNAGTLLNLEPEKKLNLTSVGSGDYTDIPREKKQTTLMTGLSGMMASIGDASSISQGVSIGFYVEQQLTRRISVRPGLAMARHSYAMENIPGTSFGASALNYVAPELDGLSGTTTSYDANIDIVSIEVPLNFVFSLRKRQRSNLFVTTGASTVVYLSQHLSGNFNNTYTRSEVDSNSGEVSYESMTTTVQIESDQEILDRVDLMGLANFSAGYSLPFGKTSHLVFEPFVQLPVKDLTSLNLRIRYGGLSMKIQF